MRIVGSSDRTLRTREKKEYNVNKLSAFSIVIQSEEEPKGKKVGKVVKKGKKKVVKKVKKGKKKVGGSYLKLVKEAVKELGDGGLLSYQAISKYIESNYPSKCERRHIRAALALGVSKKTLVKSRHSYRFSKKELEKQSKSKKRSQKKKASGSASKKTGLKKTKVAKKRTTTPKEKPSKKRPLKEKSPKKKPASKKNNAVRSDKSAEAPEPGKGVWQYHDHGWHDYYQEASDIVEGVYSEYIANPGMGLDVRSVKSGKFHYLVDFNTMTQQNTETGTKRNIQRKTA